METNPEALHWRSLYKIIIGSILPRPIGWISSVNAEGQPNLAPFSFFNAVGSNPPSLLFCPDIRSTDGSTKDTLNNVRATGEFVANIVTEAVAEAMNLTATELPADVNEFEFAGLTAAPSVAVKPPRVAESPMHYECRVSHIIELGDQPGGGSVVIGRVVHLHVEDELLIDGDKIDLARLKPIGRLAGSSYARITDIFDMQRLPPRVPKQEE